MNILTAKTHQTDTNRERDQWGWTEYQREPPNDFTKQCNLQDWIVCRRSRTNENYPHADNCSESRY